MQQARSLNRSDSRSRLQAERGFTSCSLTQPHERRNDAEAEVHLHACACVRIYMCMHVHAEPHITPSMLVTRMRNAACMHMHAGACEWLCESGGCGR